MSESETSSTCARLTTLIIRNFESFIDKKEIRICSISNIKFAEENEINGIKLFKMFTSIAKGDSFYQNKCSKNP